MRKYLFAVLFGLFTCPLFATGIDAGATSADCDNATLGQYNGTANLEMDWQQNTILVDWYDGDNLLSVQNAAQTCSYGGDLYLPTAPTKKGYTFEGWTLKTIFVPSGYTQLEYIESNGTQWISTGIMSNGRDLKTELKMQLTMADTGERAIVGLKDSCSCYEIYFTGGTRVGAYHNSGQYTWVKMNYTTGVPYTIISEMTNNSIMLSVNDIQNSYSGSMNGFPEEEVVLFRLCGHYVIYARLYYTKMWKNGTLVRYLIPAKRNSDNVVGMYDTVSKTFFTNAGSGAFITGPVVQ